MILSKLEISELHRCKNDILCLPVNHAHIVVQQPLDRHNTLPCVLIYTLRKFCKLNKMCDIDWIKFDHMSCIFVWWIMLFDSKSCVHFILDKMAVSFRCQGKWFRKYNCGKKRMQNVHCFMKRRGSNATRNILVVHWASFSLLTRGKVSALFIGGFIIMAARHLTDTRLNPLIHKMFVFWPFNWG